MVRALAREAGGRGVRVNAVAPGYITTDMTAALTDEQRDGAPGADAARAPRRARGRGRRRGVPLLAGRRLRHRRGAVGGRRAGDVVSRAAAASWSPASGLVTSLGIGREENWAGGHRGPQRRRARSRASSPWTRATTIACQVQRLRARPTSWTTASRAAHGPLRPVRRRGRAGWRWRTPASTVTDAHARPRIGAMVGQRHRRPRHVRRADADRATERGPGPRLAPLHPDGDRQHGRRRRSRWSWACKGPLSCISTACASGNHALGDATEIIRTRPGRRRCSPAAPRPSITRIGHRRLQRDAGPLHAQRRPGGRQPPVRRAAATAS